MPINSAIAVNSAEPLSSPPPSLIESAENAAFEVHGKLGGSEEEHIQKALEASQTAMDAIGTVTNLATYTLTILGLILGLLALFGIMAIYRGAKAAAQQIANRRWDSYVGGEEFRKLVTQHVEKTVETLWQEREVGRLAQTTESTEGVPEFPAPPQEEVAGSVAK